MNHWMAAAASLAALWAGDAAAQACPNSGTPTLPTGRVTYAIGESLYYYEFKTHGQAYSGPVLIATASWGLSGAENPVFTPDGQAIAFTAIDTVGAEQYHDIFYWRIGDELPSNLTRASPGGRNEDVKFAPSASGALTMTWKHEFGIATATLTFDSSNTPALSNFVEILPEVINGVSLEKSDPTFSADGKQIYYFTGATTSEQIALLGRSTPPFSEPAGFYFYYPVVNYADAAGEFYFVSGPVSNDSHGPDKIFVYPSSDAINPASSPSMFVSLSDGADNSDPAPIDGDYFIFSRRAGGNYELYLGRLSTGDCWALPFLSVGSGDALGANYTAVPIATTPWSMGGANYTTGSGGGDDDWGRQ